MSSSRGSTNKGRGCQRGGRQAGPLRFSHDLQNHLTVGAFRLLSNPQFADLKLQCGAKTWYINKTWLCANSFRFADLFQKSANPGLDSIFADLVPSAVGAMIRFLYHGEYDDEDYDETEFDHIEDSSPLLFNAYVYQVATEMEFWRLQSEAHDKFRASAKDVTRSTYIVAIKEIFAMQSLEPLRHIIVDACVPHVEKILGPALCLTYEENAAYRRLREVTIELESFADELKLKAILPPPKPNGHDCTEQLCSRMWHPVLCRKCYGMSNLHDVALKKELVLRCGHCGNEGCEVVTPQWAADVTRALKEYDWWL